MTQTFRSFSEFWPFYLHEHRNPLNRRLHWVGTILAVLCILGFLITGWIRLLFAAPLVAYGLAWYGHFRVERNRPATFKYPLWSLLGDFRMCWLISTGQFDQEQKRALTNFPPPRDNSFD